MAKSTCYSTFARSSDYAGRNKENGGDSTIVIALKPTLHPGLYRGRHRSA
jgi:hypothetical protein